MSELIERLEDCARRIDIDGTPSQIVSAEELREIAVGLQEALAAAEARIAAKDEALTDARKWLNGQPERSTCKAATWSELIASIDAALVSDPLPTLLAETQKKAIGRAAKASHAP